MITIEKNYNTYQKLQIKYLNNFFTFRGYLIYKKYNSQIKSANAVESVIDNNMEDNKCT